MVKGWPEEALVHQWAVLTQYFQAALPLVLKVIGNALWLGLGYRFMPPLVAAEALMLMPNAL